MKLDFNRFSRRGSLRAKVGLALLALSIGQPLGADDQLGSNGLGKRIAIVGNTFADQLRNHGYFEALLQQHDPEASVSLRNLGWAGDTLRHRDRPTNFPPEASTLSDHRADAIIAFFGMSESFAGETGVADFKKDLETFVDSHRGQRYNAVSDVRLVLVSPIAYENLGKLTPRWEQRNRELKRYADAMREVANRLGVPFVDLYEPTRSMMMENGSRRFTTNGIHPNEYGYWAVSRILYRELVSGAPRMAKPWRVSLDANSNAQSAEGLELVSVAKTRRGFSFEAKELTAPALPPPSNLSEPTDFAEYRDTLAVSNLAPGNYILRIDGEDVIRASHEEWAKGVAIDASPIHRAAEAYREAIIDKNRQFEYSWKALNQVHIVGERRNSLSGKALPAEVIQFNEIAKKRDVTLADGIPLKTRRWELVLDTN